MATGREFLQSIMQSVGKLQNESDADLQAIDVELAEIDNLLQEAVDLVQDEKED